MIKKIWIVEDGIGCVVAAYDLESLAKAHAEALISPELNAEDYAVYYEVAL